MAYEKTIWQAGDTITSGKLNNIEDGIAAALVAPPTGASDSYRLLGVAANGDYSLIDAEYGYRLPETLLGTAESADPIPAILELVDGQTYTFKFVDADHPDGIELTATATTGRFGEIVWNAQVEELIVTWTYELDYDADTTVVWVEGIDKLSGDTIQPYPVSVYTGGIHKVPKSFLDSGVPDASPADLGKVLMVGLGGHVLWERLPSSGLKIQTTNVTINKSNTSITAGQLTTVSKTISKTYDEANGTIKATFLISNNADYKVMYLSDLQYYGSGSTREDVNLSMTVLGLNTTTVNSVSCTVVVLYQ